MAKGELAGYVLLLGYGVVFLWLVRRFGLARIVRGALVVVALAFVTALSTLRGIAGRRG